MKGIRILLHSIRQVTGNLDGALKVSVLPYAVQVVAGLVFAGGVGQALSAGPAAAEGVGLGLGLGGLVVLIVALVTSLWIAVAWHRYILLGETPSGFVPPFDKDRILAYFLRSLGYGLILVAGGAVLGMILGPVLTPLLANGNFAAFMILMALLVQLPMVILGFRLTAALPAAALGTERDFLTGWRETTGATADIALLAAVVVGALLVIGLIDVYLFSGVWILSLVWNVVVGWFVTMIGASILTTLYGHYVEKRALV